MSGHTPGPWDWTSEMPGHSGTPDIDPAAYEPAQVNPSDREDEPICWLSPHFPDATDANACLIAAAPELLSALKALREATTDAYKTGRVDALAFVTAGNAIAKATGQ